LLILVSVLGLSFIFGLGEM